MKINAEIKIWLAVFRVVVSALPVKPVRRIRTVKKKLFLRGRCCSRNSRSTLTLLGTQCDCELTFGWFAWITRAVNNSAWNKFSICNRSICTCHQHLRGNGDELCCRLQFGRPVRETCCSHLVSIATIWTENGSKNKSQTSQSVHSVLRAGKHKYA